jgi:lysine 2,3-aminomutase
MEALTSILELSDAEKGFMSGNPSRRLPFAITPYYAALLDSHDPTPLRRCVVPVADEYERVDGELADPLAEAQHSPLPGVIHRYQDRVLLLVESECPTYCRYCTRGRRVGRGHSLQPDSQDLTKAIEYIAANDTVHDVLISGGEPLLWSDDDLESLLGKLAEINHLDYVRIGTKVPMTLPQRITPHLCRIFAQSRIPLYFSLHASHANELTVESRHALKQLADAGCPLGSQTVLLKGVNDSEDALTALFRGLLRSRVKPYYLLFCDPVLGSSRFWVSVDDAKDLMNALRRHVSGYAIPHLIMDLPEGGGKIPIAANYRIGEDDTSYHYRNCDGQVGFHYPKLP